MGTKIVQTLYGVGLCGIPMWLYLVARWFFGSEGFWHDPIFERLGVFIFWFVQLVFVLLLISWVVDVWRKKV